MNPLLVFSRPLLVGSALAVGGLFFVPFYLLAVFWRAFLAIRQFLGFFFDLPHTPTWPWFWLSLAYLLSALFLSDLGRYLLVSLSGIGLALAALLWARPGRTTRALLALTLLAILAFPWFYRYQPAVVAAPGHEMHVPTQTGLLDGVVKRAQVATEIRPCTYTLLGWSAEGVLYYQADCRGEKSQLWAYDPEQERLPRKVNEAPANLTQGVPQVSAREQVRAPGVYPPAMEPYARDVYVRGLHLASPDGRWVAVVARHIYGPEDVVVLTQSSLCDRKGVAQ